MVRRPRSTRKTRPTSSSGDPAARWSPCTVCRCAYRDARPRATAIEYRELVAVFVHTAIAVDAFRHHECRTLGVIGGYELRSRARTEAQIVRVFLRRKDLYDAQSVLAVGQIGEGAGVGHA